MDPQHKQVWSETYRGNIIHREDIHRLIVLDGEKIDSLEGFFREFGEAVNGPNGYFGRNLVAFVDCLHGGFGIKRPFSILWKNAALTRLSLNHSEITKLVQQQLDKAFYFQEGDEDHLYLLKMLDNAKQQQGPTAFESLVENIHLFNDIYLGLIE